MTTFATLKHAYTHLALTLSGAAIGAFVFSRHATLTSGEVTFSTYEDTHCLAKLRQAYKQRATALKASSAEDAAAYRQTGDAVQKTQILEKVVARYVAPTADDRLFGADVVVYHGNGQKPVIMPRADFEKDVTGNWKAVLYAAGVKHCADTYRLGSAARAPSAKAAFDRCVVQANRRRDPPPCTAS